MTPELTNNQVFANRKVKPTMISQSVFALGERSTIIRDASVRASYAVHGRRTISPNVVKHIAGYAFEDLVTRWFDRVTGGRSVRADSQDAACATHDILVGNTRFEIKCRHGVRDDARMAREKDFDVKVNAYNDAWQTPDYYVFGYCCIRDNAWHFEILGYRDAAFLKSPERLVQPGAARANGEGCAAAFTAPAYLAKISDLYGPDQLSQHIYELAYPAVDVPVVGR